MNLTSLKAFADSRVGVVTGIGLFSAAATALWVEMRARRAKRENPARGQFIEIDGVRLHYVERGTGSPVVLIHGNAVSLEDFEASGLLDRLAVNHRVIAIDRPGFGHSNRPRDRMWTPTAQAKVLREALQRLGIGQATLVGHSMGAMVAVALALDHPEYVSRLVLLSGYYYPSMRIDALMMTPVALPVLGDAMRHTVTAVLSRASLKGAVKGMFAPNDIPENFFDVMSREMMLRPVQLRANAEDAAFMIPEAAASAKRYGELRMPLAIFSGEDDAIVDPQDHSARLHRDVEHSELFLVPRSGHMLHYSVPAQIVEAIDASPESIRMTPSPALELQ